MGNLPISRNTTYAADSPIKAADLNDIQDCIIGRKHGDVTMVLSPFVGFVADTAPALTVGGGPGGAPGVLTSTGSAKLYVPFSLLVGDRIKSVTFARYGNGVANFTNVIVQRYSKAGVLTNLGSSGLIAAPPAAWNDTTIDNTDTTITDGDSIFLEVVFSATGLNLGPIRYTYDHP